MDKIKNVLGGGSHHNNDVPATGTYTGTGHGTGTHTVPGTPSGTTTTGVTGSNTGSSAQYNQTHTAGQKLESHVPGTQQNREKKLESGTGTGHASTGAHSTGAHSTGAHTTGRETDTVTTVTHVDKERDNARNIADRDACDTKFYTTVEDRPVVKEHVDVIREHRPVEKEFVVETRHTGREKELAAPPAEILNEKTRIISEARPSPCEGAPRI